ncbi:TIGR02253 family HAD-type hydrolase [bacterium]|nr:TIGR02253 family HAD-type hydrolase [bacterium]
MIKAIIFDLDNTLVDFMKMKEEAVDAAIKAMIDAGLKLEAVEIKRKIYEVYEEEGLEFQEVFDKFLLREFGEINYKILAAGIVAYRKAREAALVLYPHVNLTLIELIKRGYKLAVLSDAYSKPAWLRLCYLNLQHIFDHVVTFEDTGVFKPNPKPFLKALELLQVKAEEALMVGDWPQRDMAGASKLGIKTAFARYGDTFGTLESGADYEIDDISELLSILEELNGA